MMSLPWHWWETEELEKAHLPQPFLHGLPASSLEPDTTNLDHPPTYVFPEPLLEESVVPRNVSTLQTTTQLQHATGNLRHLVGELKAGLYNRTTDQERVLHIAIPEVEVPPICAAEKETAHYTPAMLDNSKGVVDVAGYIPHEVILDTGAAKVMISKKFAEALGIDLTPLTSGQEFVTAGGSVETTMAQTTAKLEFILSRGTDHELRVTLSILVLETNAYCVRQHLRRCAMLRLSTFTLFKKHSR